ncbi:acyl-CoA reductase-like NAD-dependent aldehyde dehydrogenase [Bradyrhizobium sp. USDA 3397]
MGPLYGGAMVERFRSALSEVHGQGKVHFGGAAFGRGFADNYVLPTVVELDRPDKLTREELFIPFVVVRGVDGIEAAIAEGNDTAYGLSAGIFTHDQNEFQYFLGYCASRCSLCQPFQRRDDRRMAGRAALLRLERLGN